MGLTLAKGIGHDAFSDSTWQGNSLTRNKRADKVYAVGMNVLRVGLIAVIAMAVLYVLAGLTGSLTNLFAADDIWTVGEKMFTSIYDSVKGIAAWAAVAGAVFCLLGIFFQRDEKAVAGKIKGLIVIGLAYVGIFILPNVIATLKGVMEGAGVTGVEGLD